MTVPEFVSSIPGFAKLSPTEMIKRFCWYLGEMRSAGGYFTVSDVSYCFTDSKLAQPVLDRPFHKVTMRAKTTISVA